jgi:hypothetical protein
MTLSIYCYSKKVIWATRNSIPNDLTNPDDMISLIWSSCWANAYKIHIVAQQKKVHCKWQIKKENSFFYYRTFLLSQACITCAMVQCSTIMNFNINVANIYTKHVFC